MNRALKCIAWCALWFALYCVAACQPGNTPIDSSETLAVINGETLTENELNAALHSLFGPAQAGALTAQAKQKALQGLVLSRVIAQKHIQSMNAGQLQALDYKLKQHRDKLLVNEYLKLHAKPAPVNEKMIADYYRDNIQQFGGGFAREYELLRINNAVKASLRTTAIERMAAARDHNDWQRFAHEQSQNGVPMIYQKNVLDSDVTNSRLAQLINTLTVGKTSQVIFIEGKPIVARVISKKARQAIPLQQVKEKIKQRLLNEQLKLAINQVQQQLLQTADVQYLGQ